MHLTSLLIGALLTLATNAAPVTDSPSQSEVPDESELFQRDSGQLCRILYTTHANCRTGPGTNYKSVLGLNKEWTRGYWFTCVKSGECITLNGAVNCGWDYFEEDGCYVNGHYTDSSCTLAKLGRC
ncbi:hypothetical protein ASPSYDRAFT_44203 [Aspergillus sydowii CBS 593.65]|uniref:Cyanovirin-N domain-containing protein n=1 Tax=Aspergillus sydowii CBS 593.65 TaxID=1036612 RepID=A0A1L9TK84_9EURO|nr:uncharacterized protein ASPSYDRAFT_44203 [Aspergillus sydowii CBS 593.65]OJJ59812.1 hypothetical protein ASPSYDRAFT_44203 [Aspergillus sydowii CBS 593.65]